MISFSSLYLIVRVHVCSCLSFHDLFQCLFCEGDCNLPLPLQSADLFHMALVPACCSLISHTLAPHLALLLNMLFLHKRVPPFFSVPQRVACVIPPWRGRIERVRYVTESVRNSTTLQCNFFLRGRLVQLFLELL